MTDTTPETIPSVPESQIDLYPHELNECKVAMAALYRGFVGKECDRGTLESFRIEAVNRFAAIGLKVDVDVWDAWLMEDGSIVPSPSINIIDRVSPEAEHDHDLHRFEVQHGEADGVEGKITLDGRLVDPEKKF